MQGTERHCELQRCAALLEMCLEPCGRRMIFEPGWPGHCKCALLWSMPGSSNNDPSSPSLWPMALLGNCFSSTHRPSRMLAWGVIPHQTWTIDPGWGRHFPFPSRVRAGAKAPTSPSHCCCRRDGVHGVSWAFPCSCASGQELPGMATAAKICCLKGTMFLPAAAPPGKAGGELAVGAEPWEAAAM